MPKSPSVVSTLAPIYPGPLLTCPHGPDFTYYQKYSWSPSGNQLAFISNSPDLVPGVSDYCWHIFVEDINSGTYKLIDKAFDQTSSVAGDGNIIMGLTGVTWSPNGTKIVFTSESTNLVSNATDGTPHLFLYDFATDSISILDVTPTGTYSDMTDYGQGQFDGIYFSPDGTKIAFTRASTNLTIDSNGTENFYIDDLATGQINLISTDTTGNPCTNLQWGQFSTSQNPLHFWSFDMTHVAYECGFNVVVPGGTGTHIFTKNILTNEITQISPNTGSGFFRIDGARSPSDLSFEYLEDIRRGR
jgi:Tol biopolymer transport system component